MAILDNVVPISVGWTPDFITDPNFQALETYSYTSGTTVSSSDGVWILGGGTLPPGLAVVGNSGIVTGVATVAIAEALNDAIGAFPGAISVAGADQPSYTFAGGTFLTKTYSFQVHGLNTSASNPPSVGSYTISVLKDWKADVDSWNALVGSPDKYSLGQK